MTNKTQKFLRDLLMQEMKRRGILKPDEQYEMSTTVVLPPSLGFVHSLPFYPAGKILGSMGFTVKEVKEVLDASESTDESQ